jgi:glycosyltransferase involved in cell wall biosynthesis
MGDLKEKSPTLLVSISCMTYNHAPYIRKCLDSFLLQKTNFPFEIVIHDDASTDGTQDIIKAYAAQHPGKIFPLLQAENQYSKGVRGLSSQYNYPRCRGKYIAICEGDDYWTDPLKLQKQVDFLEAHDDYVLTYHDFSIVDEHDNIINDDPLPLQQKQDASQQDLICGDRLTMTLTLCFRNILKEFPPEKNKVTNGDTFLISMLGQYGKGKWMGDVIQKAIYRSHRGGVWSSLSGQQKIPRQITTYYWMFRYYLRLGKIGYAFKWFSKIPYVLLTRHSSK